VASPIEARAAPVVFPSIAWRNSSYRLREVRLAGEVVVDARLGDGKFRADVGIGEAVVVLEQ